MSPTKKMTRKKTAKKKPAKARKAAGKKPAKKASAKKKPASRGSAGKKKPATAGATTPKAAKRSPAKTAAPPSKKSEPKKASRKKEVAKKAPAKAAEPAKKVAAKKTAGRKVASEPSGGDSVGTKAGAVGATRREPRVRKATPERRSKAVARGRPTPLSGVPHPKYGLKFECFECGIKFYAMGKPEPTCPKCGADQRARPRDEPKTAAKPKRAAVRPMAPLLDDDDEVARDVDSQTSKTVVDEMFDDLETVAAEDQDEPPKPSKEDAS